MKTFITTLSLFAVLAVPMASSTPMIKDDENSATKIEAAIELSQELRAMKKDNNNNNGNGQRKDHSTRKGNFTKYSRKLARTLSALTAEQQSRIFTRTVRCK